MMLIWIFDGLNRPPHDNFQQISALIVKVTLSTHFEVFFPQHCFTYCMNLIKSCHVYELQNIYQVSVFSFTINSLLHTICFSLCLHTAETQETYTQHCA